MNTKIHAIALVYAIAFGSVFTAKAQTKIKDGSISGTTILPNKDAVLELESSTRGILYPRVALDSTSSPAPLSSHVKGMVVYDTAYAGTGATAVSLGIYYNDGSQWIKMGTGTGSSNTPADWYKFGTTIPAVNTDSQYVIGRVAIGQNTAATVDAANTAAKLTVAGGDASINGLTVGRGSGQVDFNTAVGNQALWNNTSGSNNTAVGNFAFHANTTGINSTAIGSNALALNSSGDNNTAVGFGSLSTVSTGFNNTAVGYNALSTATGTNNTALGNNAGSNITTGSGNIVIGAFQTVPTTTSPQNLLNIGGAIFGTGLTSTDPTAPAGNIGINNTNPLAKLTVDNQGTTTPVLQLKAPFAGTATDSILTWNPADSTVRKIAPAALPNNAALSAEINGATNQIFTANASIDGSFGPIFAPVTGDTSGKILVSNGNAAPVWTVGDWIKAGTTSTTAINTDSQYVMGRVGIGTSSLNASAVLDITSANKGVLFPRVALDSSTDITTILNPAVGLMVYNTGTSPTFSTVGYLFWDGTQWKIFTSGSSAPASAILNCAGAQMAPGQQVTGGTAIISGTVIQIPYTGGNGGSYGNATLVSVGNPNVTGTIQSGILAMGNGMLNISISGVPTTAQQAPTGITFDLTPFLSTNTGITGCNSVTVGNVTSASISSVAVMDFFRLNSDNGVTGYGVTINSPDGRFSCRAFIVSDDYDANALTFGTDNYTGINLQIRSNMPNDVIISGEYQYLYQGGSAGSASNLLAIQPGKWSGDNQDGFASTTPNWAGYLDGTAGAVTHCGNPTATKAAAPRCHFVAWGNDGVMAGGAPENRYYTWSLNDVTTTSANAQDKTFYLLTFSSSSSKPGVVASAANCPGGVCPTKAYLKIEQVTAVN